MFARKKLNEMVALHNVRTNEWTRMQWNPWSRTQYVIRVQTEPLLAFTFEIE